MFTNSSRPQEPNWRDRKALLHWRVGIPVADVADLLGLQPAAVEFLVARDHFPARLIDGWVLFSYPSLVDPDRDPRIAKLQHAWSQMFEWEADMASDRFPDRPSRHPDDCSCDGCLTHYRPSEPRS